AVHLMVCQIIRLKTPDGNGKSIINTGAPTPSTCCNMVAVMLSPPSEWPQITRRGTRGAMASALAFH
ncbi:MAG TPA: hypothetical protein VIJ25_20660, partial [Methylococcales bacterium]